MIIIIKIINYYFIIFLQYSLRQLDLSLLSQLWSLNESIQDFRQMLQDQEDRVLSPPSPSPSPSSGDEGDGDEFYTPSPMRFRPAPPPPALRRTSNSSSDTSSVQVGGLRIFLIHPVYIVIRNIISYIPLMINHYHQRLITN